MRPQKELYSGSQQGEGRFFSGGAAKMREILSYTLLKVVDEVLRIGE